MNIDESKVPTAAKGSIEAGYGPKHRGDSLAAADLGVKIKPEEQDEIVPQPAQFVGNSLVNKPVNDAAREMRRPEFYTKFDGTTWADEYAEMDGHEQAAFRCGFLAARGEITSDSKLFDKLSTLFEWLSATKKGT